MEELVARLQATQDARAATEAALDAMAAALKERRGPRASRDAVMIRATTASITQDVTATVRRCCPSPVQHTPR